MLLSLTGCSSSGPEPVTRDRFDYNTAISDFWTKHTFAFLRIFFTWLKPVARRDCHRLYPLPPGSIFARHVGVCRNRCDFLSIFQGFIMTKNRLFSLLVFVVAMASLQLASADDRYSPNREKR